MTTVRLVVAGGRMMTATFTSPLVATPHFLVSFHYIKKWPMNLRVTIPHASWSLDSGAFSAFFGNSPIDLEEYIERCRFEFERDVKLTEVFSLDVIDDWKKSRENTERMWSMGIPAIPVYHRGDPWSVLEGMAREYPKVGIGGAARWRQLRAKHDWMRQCLARVWRAAGGPKAVHGLGFTSRDGLLAAPCESADASSWSFGPQAFGMWYAYAGRLTKLSSRGITNLAAEANYYLRSGLAAEERWRKDLRAARRRYADDLLRLGFELQARRIEEFL